MHRLLRPYAAGLALAALCAAGPARADSLVSSASSAGSTSSASISDSIGDSSDASSKDKKVAEGEYRVIDVALAQGRPEVLRLRLQATQAGSPREFDLYLPEQALAEQALKAGDLVLTRQRPYGFEFAHANTQRAFFLALTDEWQRDLGSRRVLL